MPVDPNNPYADVAHEKTVQRAGWTDDGRRVMRPHVTEWLTVNHEGKPMYCGHLMRLTDPQCTGCENRRDE